MKTSLQELARRSQRILGMPWRAFMRSMGNTYLSLCGVKVGSGLKMRSLPVCRRHADATICIGKNVIIRNKLRENLAGICHRTVLVASRPNAKLSIGDSVGISGAIIYCSLEIVIEDGVWIGAGARIYDTDFHALDAEERRAGLQSGVRALPVRIGEEAWIGAGAVVLKGVTIGARSVIGAGSVVSRDVPSDTIAVGVPARPVRSLLESAGDSG